MVLTVIGCFRSVLEHLSQEFIPSGYHCFLLLGRTIGIQAENVGRCRQKLVVQQSYVGLV